MYEKEGKCKSQCSECGVACEAPRLTSIVSVERFEKLECEVVLGTVDLSSVHDVPEQDLFEAFERVTKIQGDLIVRNIPGIMSLGFLHNLRQVNNIVIDNCADLVDARLPELVGHDSVSVAQCPRLCEARQPKASSNATECGATQLEQYFEVQGLVTIQPLTQIAAKLTEALRGLVDSKLEVSMLGWW
jgi:hypothetical protein